VALDGTKATKGRQVAFHVFQVNTKMNKEEYLAKIVKRMHTNPNPMLRNAFQCKKVSTNQVQQAKSNAQRVKQDVVATLRVTIVKLDRIKIYPATPRVANAPVDLATKP
tara:strand:+ start:13 stop:339 length:327 start_codon:yes stop_codon:yes gene_type:complete